MNTLLIFIWIYAAMIAMGFWEAYVEGRNPWDQRKVGWKIKFGKYVLTGYHFFLFIVMLPLLLTLPLVIYGWDWRVFGIILSAYMSGTVIEDFTWFLANPTVRVKNDFNPKFAGYYPWLKIGKFQIPLAYPLGILFALLSWYFLWR
jgi:hypothetical protein